MNKIKKFLTALMAVALVLCVGYFSGMAKTSAWFYDSGTIDSGDSFVFGNLSVNTKFVINHTVAFDAATKLADKNETLFDKTVNFDDVNVTNSGNVPARVYFDIDVTNGAKGYRWFVYTDDMLVDGSVKEMIKANVPSLSKSGLDQYNRSKYILLAPNETKTIKIASWIEYDDVKADIANGKSVTVQKDKQKSSDCDSCCYCRYRCCRKYIGVVRYRNLKISELLSYGHQCFGKGLFPERKGAG